ncbi:acyl-ACP--UDP-N-acetylglucosamine O-acyltransferase [Acetonema longum]|uniref:Acyl-[acyl-carrier-protein]--UDP-N-acetylglucosamine O-acyltransferase n=1 Tax=Acetonema longum DSM 6540 TaxID=1009370 RepID=F7NP19_9FIRM|nr:acyl-ACP--UDP-N-acetylglucosamine O-acyltransferase [Acetonema longum]EGO62142.1 acyl-(acyl-carrier-protein)--UDP-N-acetylglucosa mineO-acyltransferase [Acetonema longum DSM 6540]
MMQDQYKLRTSSNIHETAVVHPGAVLGKNVDVGPYAVIGQNVRIGDNTVIKSHAIIDGWTDIGVNCEIYPCASIGSPPQDQKFRGEKSYIVIGDNTQIREFVTVNGATGEGQETRVGSDCLLLAYCHVAHNCVIGNHVVVSSAAMIAGHVVVGDRATIGGLTGIHQFVRIGRNAMVGGASKIVQDVPPFITAAGNPAQAAGLNTVGMTRAGIGETTRQLIKRAYKILYLSGLGLSCALEIMEQQIPECEEVADFIQFLRNTERGICRVACKARQ